MADKDVSPTLIAEEHTLDSSKKQIEEIQLQTTERMKSALRTQYGIKESPNAILSLPFDVFRCMPVESLHTILLGPYKYLLKSTIPTLSRTQKEEVLARVRAFGFSGFRDRLYGNVIRYHQSFMGRDYKAWAQMSLFIIYPYLSAGDQEIWLSLTKIAYCNFYDSVKHEEWNEICQAFVDAVKIHKASMLQKQKVHLLLYLVECMRLFGPTYSFNSERCETFNSYIHTQNIFGNKRAPSRDIGRNFVVMEHLRYISDGGAQRTGRCGGDLKTLFSLPIVQHFFNSVPIHDSNGLKAIYQPGTLRKAQSSSAVKLSTVTFNLHDALNVPLCDLPLQQQPFTLHIGHLQLDDLVKEFHAVVGRDSNLVNCGDYVKLHSCHYEMTYGVLLSCFRTTDGRNACALRGFELVCSPSGEPVVNGIECPLLLLSQVVFLVRPLEIEKSISVAHECGNSCKFVTVPGSTIVERQSVPS